MKSNTKYLDLIKKKIGRKEYESASRKAKSSIEKFDFKDTKTKIKGLDKISAIIDRISDIIDELNISSKQKVRLYFDIYKDIPRYSVLFQIGLIENQKNRKLILDKYRKYLSSNEEVFAKPIEYDLWCGYFEAQDLKALNSLLSGKVPDILMQRILNNSGPLPYKVKRKWYDKFVKDEKWHPYIFESLLRSESDVYGKIDRTHAKKIFSRLRLSHKTTNLDYLQRRLGYYHYSKKEIKNKGRKKSKTKRKKTKISSEIKKSIAFFIIGLLGLFLSFYATNGKWLLYGAIAFFVAAVIQIFLYYFPKRKK